jgi:hypothetical protein
MSYSRPKLMLDEQSFQDMLAAAFTIQEHNAQRRKNARPPARVCSQCGAPAIDDSPLCDRCANAPRQGEELQRKWASLWLMSQEQGLFEKPTAGQDEESPTNQPANIGSRSVESPSTQARIVESPILDSPIFDSSIIEPSRDLEDEVTAPAVRDLRLQNATAYQESEIESDPIELPQYDEPSNSALAHLRILPDVTDLAAEGELPAEEYDEQTPAIKPWSLPDLNLKLRFHRADFYLVIAIVVSTFAMVWVLSATPTAGAHQKPRLRPWERAMVSLGLAEAPEAPARRGNPAVSVWVDPKTALYYCAGEELYGKAPGGHVATQREAQLDQFEPAGLAPCD